MDGRILITGGAGFIGSHLADELLRRGYRVRALDALVPQVHGPHEERPAYLNRDVELMVGDVRDRDAVKRAVEGVDAVFHFAALVGVGQSMYQVEDYTSVNNLGTAVLLEVLAQKPVRRLVVASSMSVYGEGLYKAPGGEVVAGTPRPFEQLKRAEWEVRSGKGEVLAPVPTPETKTPGLESVYALSKYDQEQLSLIVGRAYGIPTTALRFFNVYGTRQALSNPYTGVLAIFASRLLNGRSPLLYEDGEQRRDFVSVYDIARACIGALTSERAAGKIVNVGSGRSRTVREVAEKLGAVTGRAGLAAQVTGKYRMGDIRHCFADIAEARALLDYEPAVDFQDGLTELAAWLEGQVARDTVEAARAELDARGLTL